MEQNKTKILKLAPSLPISNSGEDKGEFIQGRHLIGGGVEWSELEWSSKN